MQRWLQFLFLLFAASAMAHVPETRCISGSPHLTGNLTQRTDAQHAWIELRLAEVRSLSGADFPVCCIARPPSQHCGGWTGFPTRRAHDVVPAADLEIGDTAGWETCATLEADAGGSPREINVGTGQRPTSGNRELLQRPDTATLSHGEIITYLLAANQTLAASYRYDPYGNTTYSSGSLAAANVYRFSSKELHLNSGLYSYGYRFYSPNWQRWLNQDPIGEWGGINLYGFVGNAPVRLVDPYGLDFSSFYGQQPLGGFYPSGPMPYLTGETPWEHVGSTLYNASARGVNSADSAMTLLEGVADLAGAVLAELTDSEAGRDLGRRGVLAFGLVLGPKGLKGKPCPPAAKAVATPPNRIYSARELIRRAEEPGPFHNFPESFNQSIFNQGARTVTPNYYNVARPGLGNDAVMYRLPGNVNGANGMFEIGVRPSVSGNTEVIMHRFFNPNP